MAAVYILYSPAIDKYYIGSCNSLSDRLQQHKDKEFNKSYTAFMANDWILFLSINNLEYKQARSIELHIKKMKSKTYFLNLKKYPEMIDRLNAKYEVRGSSR